MPNRKTLAADALLVLAVFVVFSCCGCTYFKVKAGGSQPPRQPTAIEQVLTWNAALADANLGIAKAVIAANEAGEIDVPTSNVILTHQSLIADADRQLTPILAKACSPQKTIQACNPAVLSGDGDAIERLVDQIKTSATGLVKSGTIGIKNTQRQQAIAQAIQTIYTLIDNVLGSLQQLGVLKPGKTSS